jgi:hypothetical protein
MTWFLKMPNLDCQVNISVINMSWKKLEQNSFGFCIPEGETPQPVLPKSSSAVQCNAALCVGAQKNARHKRRCDVYGVICAASFRAVKVVKVLG